MLVLGSELISMYVCVCIIQYVGCGIRGDLNACICLYNTICREITSKKHALHFDVLTCTMDALGPSGVHQ